MPIVIDYEGRRRIQKIADDWLNTEGFRTWWEAYYGRKLSEKELNKLGKEDDPYFRSICRRLKDKWI